MLSYFKMLLSQKDIKKRLGFTLFIFFIFRLGSGITVPGVSIQQLAENSGTGVLGLMDMLGGGALSRFSLFAMGVTPYITASIIIQLLSMDVIPYLTEQAKSGDQGKQKLNQITKILTVVLAMAQAIGLSYLFTQQYKLVVEPSAMKYLGIAIILTAGTMVLMWLADRINEHGLGNGISLIIFAGIVSQFPKMFEGVTRMLISVDGASNIQIAQSVLYYMLFIAGLFAFIAFIVLISESVRKVPVQAATAKANAKVNYMPLKVNNAGVIPVIFASSLMTAPVTIMSFMETTETTTKIKEFLNFQNLGGMTIYLALIIAFTFFYSHIQVDGEKIAENLQKNGSYVPGVRQGEETKIYFKKLVTRLSVIGSLSLAFIAGLPIVLGMIFPSISNLGLGGTSFIIVVGVALDTKNRIDGMMTNRIYKGFIQ